MSSEIASTHLFSPKKRKKPALSNLYNVRVGRNLRKHLGFSKGISFAFWMESDFLVRDDFDLEMFNIPGL